MEIDARILRGKGRERGARTGTPAHRLSRRAPASRRRFRPRAGVWLWRRRRLLLSAHPRASSVAGGGECSSAGSALRPACPAPSPRAPRAPSGTSSICDGLETPYRIKQVFSLSFFIFPELDTFSTPYFLLQVSLYFLRVSLFLDKHALEQYGLNTSGPCRNDASASPHVLHTGLFVDAIPLLLKL